MTDNFEKDINVPSKRPPYEIALMHDHILRLEEELKAKEQECERLNEELYYWVNGEYCDNKCNVVKELDQLKAENDNIKETFDGLFKVQYKLADNNKKLRQCLTEIKEIAEKQCVCGVNCQDMKIILQKISKCEGNDEIHSK